MRVFIIFVLVFCQTVSAEIAAGFSSVQTVEKKLPLASLGNSASNALAELYQPPFQGRGVLKKSYQADGSRTRLINELEKIPGKFAGFSRIDSVYVKSRYQWGEYTILYQT